jgi:hypothetical protein
MVNVIKIDCEELNDRMSLNMNDANKGVTSLRETCKEFEKE